MQKRKLRFVKRTPPAIGVCERCNSQFKSSQPSGEQAEVEIVLAFTAHKCQHLEGLKRDQQ